ncbi:MAG: polyprenyl synthetase family protein [Treponema sp.]|jgi:octaprenyl-diphosphate synthase|nr:polyprenyl synthetase family protein [Treponema sp.]
MNNEYILQIKKIEAELEKWLPGFNDTGTAAFQDTSTGSIWAQEEFPEAVKKITDESLRFLLTPVKDMLSRGGKRWRPLLMTLVCESLGGGDAALPLTPLVEFSHNASLIHDDIEDDSDERRGKPAVHKVYGVDTAINSGSFLYFLSLSCIEFYKGENKALIYKLWAEYMRGLHLGQAIDISWHKQVSFIPTIDEYFVMCGLKTGSLARLAAETGAYTAGASVETALKFGNAAEKLGIGFQILDDVKNLTTGVPGKLRGDDVVEGKKSLPVLLYLTRYPKKREMVYYCFHAAKINGAAVPEVEELINALTSAGVLAESEEKAHSMLSEASETFSSIEVKKSAANEKSHILLNGLIDAIS